ncbi:YciY family protein [Candidatus Erwinia dacicola]|uniref:YciY family protein n=1 Tax=Candidatus Erwinia dacicola TaxID=252393 RepID=UPI0009F48E54|nr:YciY family protein [Candidatus Erwinia dacicola]
MRRRSRCLEGQSRRYGRMHSFRYQVSQQQRRSIFLLHRLPEAGNRPGYSDITGLLNQKARLNGLIATCLYTPAAI